MKRLFILIPIFTLFSCSSPYINPQVSKAVSEEEQLEQLKIQNELLREQNKHLSRIATSLEVNTKVKDTLIYKEWL